MKKKRLSLRGAKRRSNLSLGLLRSLCSLAMTISITVLVLAPVLNAYYDSTAPLNIVKVDFSVDKPKGMGRYEARGSGEFKKGDTDVYIYVEVGNCKPVKKDRFYHIDLVMDMDIYYEDGFCVYSERDANSFHYETIRRNTDAYAWAKIEAKFLKKGEYKVEMTIRDENSDKESFALTTFERL